MNKIFIDCGDVKAKNGLYYFAVNLQSYLSKNGYSVEIINCRFTGASNNSLEKKQTTFNKNLFDSITIVPTIRFKLKQNVFYFLHDDYPISQPSPLKRIYNKIHLFACNVFGRVIYISDSLPKRLGVDNYIKLTNLDIISDNDDDNHNNKYNEYFYASALIIGVETDRKNLHMLPQMITSYSEVVDFSKTHIVGEFLQKKDNALQKINASYHTSRELHSIRPQNKYSFYISLSSSEGFNRGAYFALKQGFQLILSRTPEHEEFYDPMYWYDLSTGKLIYNKKQSMLKEQSQKHIKKFFNALENRC